MRWRKFFGYDQLDWIVEELTANPDTRRCVLSMWDPGAGVASVEGVLAAERCLNIYPRNGGKRPLATLIQENDSVYERSPAQSCGPSGAIN